MGDGDKDSIRFSRSRYNSHVIRGNLKKKKKPSCLDAQNVNLTASQFNIQWGKLHVEIQKKRKIAHNLEDCPLYVHLEITAQYLLINAD